MKAALERFVARIQGYDELAHRQSALVPYFAHFVDEEASGAVITPKALVAIFEDLRLRGPANPSDALRKCKLLVKVKSGGYRLNHHGRLAVLANLNPVAAGSPLVVPPAAETRKQENTESIGTTELSAEANKNVFVVYGRDERLRRDLFSFLRTLGLNPMEFEEMAHLTGSASPFTLEIVETGFQNAQACVVLFSPDEFVSLRKGLREESDSDSTDLQPRPNVLIEAGMALALQPKRTVLVRVGKVRDFSDLYGKNYVNLTNTADSRNKLIGRLQASGCDVKRHGSDWLNVGNFKPTEEETK